MSDGKTNPFPPPISDEGLERWIVQFQYASKVVIGPIERTEFGAILQRLRVAEQKLSLAKDACMTLTEVAAAFVKERDEARVVAVEQRLQFMPDCESPPDPLRSKRHTAIGMFKVTPEEAERLFPEKEPT